MKSKIIKNIAIIFTGLLLLWFAFDITGLAINNTILVVSAIVDEPIDILFLIIFIFCFLFFIMKDKYGKYVLLAFLVLWSIAQFPKWFTADVNSIESYNNFFRNEGTYYTIAQSKERLIKDTYHIILDILIFLSLVSNIIFTIKSRMKRK